MHPTIAKLVAELNQTYEDVVNVIPDNAINLVTGNVGMGGVTRTDLLRRLTKITDKIEAADPQDIGDEEAHLYQLGAGLQWMRTNTIPHIVGGNPSALPAFYLTMDAIERAVEPFVESDKGLALESGKALKRVTSQIRGMESRLRDLSPKTSSVQSMVERIERAYEAADQLPADLETLNEARQRISAISVDAEKDRAQIVVAKENVEATHDSLQSIAEDAASILKQCESVYSSATSVGLAAAFAERSKNLGISMWFWVAGLVTALVVGGAFGSSQLRSLSNLLSQSGTPTALIGLNIMLSVLSVGAPVWFAWLATKQIGQRFRISEDYAFKAAVSRAYEGYRREAVRIDSELEGQLLRSALQRLDEQPLRLVEPTSYGSPWHELLASDSIKDALKSVPGFAESLSRFTKEALDGIKPKKTLPPAANNAISSVVDASEKSAG
ncbi:hypothetical protein [Pseudomonas protegens]|uniref:hypothetical protein n=1 Tax=Pseudomonas protegens TaxID=380021 RepID=UPI0021CC8515|nr:hypothetical protein [Pseudomonas protegens]